MKGVFFSGGVQYKVKKNEYELKYHFYGMDHRKLDNYNNYLVYSHSSALSIGYRIPVKKFSFIPNVGMHIGAGRFEEGKFYSGSQHIGENIIYFKTGFVGIIIGCAASYDLTDKIRIGLGYTAFFNNCFYPSGVFDKYSLRYFKHLNDYHGLQLAATYKLWS